MNGVAFDQVEYPLECEPVRKAFWYVPQAGDCVFRCRTPFNPNRDLSDPFVEIQFVRKDSNVPFRPSQASYYCFGDHEPLPPLELRRRVHRGDDAFSFNSVGATTFMQFQQVLKSLGFSGYQAFAHILDWGCGCGRSTRYFRHIRGASVTGIDIDAEALAWCREN
ncbi:MAG TPA: class I SAM-dependent methyltransferase, partial [bacterium]|nr:class I SAM-dependent methyltransferase [bacterium]